MMDKKQQPAEPDWDKILKVLEEDKSTTQNLSPEELMVLTELREIKNVSGRWLTNYQSVDTDRKWAEFKKQASLDTETEHLVKKKTHRLWITRSAAAAAIVVIGLAALFYFNQQDQTSIQQVNVFVNNIPPGKNSATLILDNGKKILLAEASSGQLANEAGINISKSASGEVIYSVGSEENRASAAVHTLATVKGETYRLRLPDKSEVWLNASSSIKFPASFAGKKTREVTINGEAYFEIAKDKEHPFIVINNHQRVQVLGTHFNISSYLDPQKTITTLLEGSLRVTNDAAAAVKITPGQQAIVTGSSNIEVVPANMKNVIAWKNGYFRFKDESIERIMLQISNWYDIEVSYVGSISQEKFSGSISRFKNISDVLNMLSYSNAVKFKVEGRRVTVMQ